MIAFAGGDVIYPNGWVAAGAVYAHDAGNVDQAKEAVSQVLPAIVVDAIQNYIRMNKKPSFSVGRTLHLYLSILLALLVRRNAAAYFPAAIQKGWAINNRIIAKVAGFK